jgi:hypothetical protein
MLICNDIANKGLCNAEAAVQNGPRSTLFYVFSFPRQWKSRGNEHSHIVS